MTLAIPPGAAVYRPRGSARAVFYERGGEVVLDGPAGTGKSRAALEKVDAVARKYPGARLAIVRKKRRSLTETGLVTWEQHVRPGCETGNALRRVRQSYLYPNRSEVVIAGVDDPVKLMSAEFDLIYVQEATELELADWELLITRLRNGVVPYQQIIGDCNPGAPSHWLKKRMDSGGTVRIPCRHEDNPRLWDADYGQWTEFGRTYITRLESLTGARRERLRYGKWVGSEGIVYTNWDERTHVIPRGPIPADWRRIRVVDFGYTHPFVCQWWAINPEGEMILYREIYMTGRTVRRHAETIRAAESPDERAAIEATICDHDAEDRATLEEELRIFTTGADKSVTTGIQSVQDRLAVGRNGRPSLFIMEDALIEADRALVDEATDTALAPLCTQSEFDEYIWATGPDGKPNKETPIKSKDHGMDALRYAVRYVDANSVVRDAVVLTSQW